MRAGGRRISFLPRRTSNIIPASNRHRGLPSGACLIVPASVLMLIPVIFISIVLPSAGFCDEKGRSTLPGAIQEEALFLPPPQEGNVSSMGAASPPVPSTIPEDPAPQKRVPPICEESNDDFSLTRIPVPRSQSPFDFDIPITVNSRVEEFILYFQTVIREKFSNWLAQSSKYEPLMRSVLQENGLPEDLVYLSLIESGFNPYAYSRSKAVGLWQFIAPTGKRYGLKVSPWVDERRDPEKSTLAAAMYLRDLYDMFECWYLAAAGYNAGEGKIARGMKRYRTDDFWQLTKYRYLKRETKDYVPQMIAAALIAKNPEGYGFDGIEYEEPLCYDKVTVPEATDIRSIAKACEVSVEELRDLNPELLRVYTPPNVSDYEIKIPCGKKNIFLANFETLQQAKDLQFKTHVARKGETSYSIAKSYRIELTSLLETNCLTQLSRLSSGQQLIVPVPLKKQDKSTPPAGKTTAKSKNQKTPKPSVPPRKV
jgi:membrane-bound lytic murein transglycosylase D